MKNSKLIVSLQHLTSSELRRFGEFVQSPFFNKHQETTQLFDILYEEKDRWESLTKEGVFSRIYSGKYRELKINTLMFNLTELLKKFLVQLESNDRGTFVRHLLNGTLKRNMWKLHNSISAKEFSELEETEIKDLSYFNRLYNVHFFTDQSVVLRRKRFSTEYLAGEGEALDVKFVLQKLKISCDMLNRMVVLNCEFDLGMLNEVLSYVESRWDYFKNNEIINIYYKILLTFLEPDNYEHYFNLVDYFEQNRSKFNKEDLWLLFRFAIGKGISFLNTDEDNFIEVVFRLYKAALEEGILIKNNEITHLDYKNIIVLACGLNKFDMAESIIEKYRPYLPVAFRKNTYNFSRAVLYHKQEKYEEALLLLSKMKFTHTFFYQINAKILQIKIFYDLEEYDLLLSFLESFRLMLMRNKKISADRIKSTQNLVFFTKKFVHLLNSRMVIGKKKFKEELEKLRDEYVTTDKPVISNKWLLKCMDQTLEEHFPQREVEG
ncbi:MAG: hypothetical protein DWQ02_27710 [Bacteroidetes bacterium]|nr:MAG: hypothetical protein DWQ02_27710 [Bacteroidota bacterium]